MGKYREERKLNIKKEKEERWEEMLNMGEEDEGEKKERIEE